MARVLAGVLLALVIFFCSLACLRQALMAYEPKVGPLLRRAAGHPAKGALLGFFVTTLIQSSSATNTLAVTLAGTGVLRIRHALAIMLGANVGTTMTAQLVALSLDEMGLPLFVAGVAAAFFPNRTVRAVGRILAGVGGLFYGLWALGNALSGLGEAVGTEIGFAGGAADGTAGNDLLSIAAGAVLTAIVQSSSAVTGLLVGLAEAGSLSVRTAIAGVLGSNVGTVTTTLMAGLPGGPVARKAALLDLWFNVAGVVVVVPFLSRIPAWMAALTGDPGRQVAHAHTLFNLVTVACVLPWVGTISRLMGDDRS